MKKVSILFATNSPLTRGMSAGRGVAKKIIISIMCVLGIATARAANENAATSKEYVDTELATKQPTIPAEGNNVVMTFDSAADDGIGTKQIYDETTSYVSQETALVTAATANAAVQMALNGELTCGMYDPDNPTDCWLWNLNSVPERTLPAGYTALPYIENTVGKEYLDLGQPIGSGENITAKFAYLDDGTCEWFGASDGTDWRSPKFTFSYLGVNNLVFMIYSTSNTNLQAHYYKAASPCEIGTPYTINWYGNPFKATILTPQITLRNIGISASNYLYTPTRNAGLFKANYPTTGFDPGVICRIMRIYYFTVEGKMNLIPARRDNDGEIGMYDTVSGNFLTNQGTGKFISGVYTEHMN